MLSTSIVAWICTGPRTGFDPLCNSSHGGAVLLATVAGAVATAVFGLRAASDQGWFAKCLLSVVFLLPGAVAGFWMAMWLGETLLD